MYTPTSEEVYNGQKTLTGSRLYEYLDRGTYAVSTGNAVFVSWRMLAQDELDISFNLYRRTDGKTVKLNNEPITGGTISSGFTNTFAYHDDESAPIDEQLSCSYRCLDKKS